ncbi:hypothetical protein, variant 2 [Saprolegnia diclina VS20]|uniref:Uncharacterized protein n=1 Tax=Saprolegnia diclina (strain VS20) TaxID=1156394 RepID=T0RUE9_SAPDV|nr:hypothetical protein, variant 1 [Saprolegnia diclina VS20]XP_008610821.1 hypothetical protein, variant 2 [Saprolegnia diclina VS20]EQC36058.1 hypothetical protein, variant 1 [Saprolegnia diclina VS20]EQC36059.1 hypothetical protein, variant 2 [Saprolegnia diclina VS20]|eukprot:XP_008610820.1 hypothetical protein, variant 1 [Saprolegnia diclina VS20]
MTRQRVPQDPLRGMEVHVQKVLDSARQAALKRYKGPAAKKPPLLAHAAWKCHAALDALRRSSSSEHSVDDSCAVQPVSADVLNREATEDEAAYAQRVERRIKRYAQHYSHGLDAISSRRGTTKSTALIDAAVHLQTSCRHTNDAGASIGVAVLSRSGNLYTAATQAPSLGVCPERLALLKLASEESESGVDGVAISSSDALFFPSPCGDCRQLMAQFGDFPIYLIRKSLEYERTTAFALFPQALQQPHVLPSAHPAPTTTWSHARSQMRPRAQMQARDWGPDHVLDWLIEDVGLPEYAHVFQTHGVDGAMLQYLQESDLEFLLRITNVLHRKRISLCLDRLRAADASDGVAFAQLDDYLAVLDMDRINVVAKLKVAFDAADVNSSGTLSFEEIKQALTRLEYAVDASAVERWIQSRSTEARVTFPEFALAVVTAYSKSTSLPVLPLPKLDVAAIRQSFERVDANGNGVIDKRELLRALELLGRSDCEAKVADWFANADEDRSGSISFPEFVLRYTQLQNLDVTPLRNAFDRVTPHGAVCPLLQLPLVFRELFVRYDGTALDRYMAARKEQTTGLSFPEFLVIYHLFVTEPEPVQTTEQVHRYRIVQLQQSGHVRLCTKPPVASSPHKPSQQTSTSEAPSKLMQFQQARKRREETKDDDTDEDESKLADEFAHVHEAFVRFRAKRVTTPEAVQALTELGLVLPRAQMLAYFTSHGFGTARDISYADLVRSYQALRMASPAFNKAVARRHHREHHGHAKRMQAAEALLNGANGKPFTRIEFDAYCRRQHAAHEDDAKEDDELPPSKHRAAEIDKLYRAHAARREARLPPSSDSDEDSDDDVAPRRQRRPGVEVGDRVVDKTRALGPATVIRLYPAYGVCDLHLDSGPKRRNVDVTSLVRFRDKPLASFAAPELFAVGDSVNVRYKGTKLWRAGVIKKVRSTERAYDVRYARDEVEKHVSHHHVRRALAAALESDEGLVEGAKVEARTRECATFLPGRILCVRTNGTFDVRFKHEDGAVKERLPKKWLRLRAKDGDKDGDDTQFEVGDAVQKQAHGAIQRGVVARCRSDGSYDVEWDDGEDETHVKPSTLQPAASAQALTMGDLVEARFGGKDKYFKGKIAHVHSDGSLDVEYDDGDRETRVAASLVRPSADAYADDDFEE